MKHRNDLQAQSRRDDRASGYRAGKNGSTRKPGSLNPHKTSPIGGGAGGRTKSAVKNDSRTATR